METAINNQLAIIENSIEVFKAGPQILTNNIQRKDKALVVGRNILAAIQANGMTPELDQRAMNYLANCNSALKEMKDQRGEVTQIMDALKKMFTEVEAEMDIKKSGTVPSLLQQARDQYAKDLFEEQERKRKEAERVAAIEKEKVNVRYAIENAILNDFNSYILNVKQKMHASFSEITLDTYEEKSKKLIDYDPRLSQVYLTELRTKVSQRSSSLLLSPEEVAAIADDVVTKRTNDFSFTFRAEMSLLQGELVDNLPSKLTELKEQKRLADEAAAEAEKQRIAELQRQEAIAKANAQEKARLEEENRIKREEEQKRLAEIKAAQERAEAERKRREQEESDRIKAEQEESRLKAEQEAEIRKQGDQTMIMFEQEAAMADQAAAPEARQGYEIEVKHPAGWVQIFQLWFENEGKNLPVDKIGNTKLDQMKAWAEKHAHKNNVKIESKFITYAESFKAVNRKAK